MEKLVSPGREGTRCVLIEVYCENVINEGADSDADSNTCPGSIFRICCASIHLHLLSLLIYIKSPAYPQHTSRTCLDSIQRAYRPKQMLRLFFSNTNTNNKIYTYKICRSCVNTLHPLSLKTCCIIKALAHHQGVSRQALPFKPPANIDGNASTLSPRLALPLPSVAASKLR